MGFPTTLFPFQSTFPDEAACWRYLRRARWPRGFRCPVTVIAELLGEKQRLPELPRSLDAVVYAFSEAERAAAVRVACALRAENRSVELVLGEPRLKRVMADADRAGAREVHLLGPDEVARGEVLIRDLTSGEQRNEPIPN